MAEKRNVFVSEITMKKVEEYQEKVLNEKGAHLSFSAIISEAVHEFLKDKV